MNLENLDIVVVANFRRKSIVEDFLTDIAHKVSLTEDYALSSTFIPAVAGMVQPSCHERHLRCFKGHQQAVRMCDKENILVLEDDAEPNCKDWLDVVLTHIDLLRSFDIVSFHGRDFVPGAWEGCVENVPGVRFLKPLQQQGLIWVCGALAYMLNRRSVEQFLALEYNGTPIDILIPNRFSFCLLEQSIFNHNRSQGSLLDAR